MNTAVIAGYAVAARPAAANLIEGSLSEVVRFLDELSERGGIEPAESERRRAALKRANGANR